MKRLTVTSSIRDAQAFQSRMNDNQDIRSCGHFEASNFWVSEWYDEYDEEARDGAEELHESIMDILTGLEVEGIEYEEDY